MEEPEKDLISQAKSVLKKNNRGSYTIPAEGLYPHQWLWDSCFIAIGLRNYDIDKAQSEILSLLEGQWSNGMVPHIIFSNEVQYRQDRNIWHSKVNPFSPDNIATSGLTQPPLLAEAVVRIGEKLSVSERRSWYRRVYPALVNYHEWLYSNRDPHDEGLVLQIHPWETGLDNTPPWMSELHDHLMPWWVRLIEKSHIQWIIKFFRRDTHMIAVEERFSNIEGLALYDAQRRIRRKGYDIDRILDHSLFAIEDLTFNCVFIRANELLIEIANSIKEDLPDELLKQMKRSARALEQLWDPYAKEYYSRDFITHRLIKESSIAAVMPLYAGKLAKERVEQVINLLEDPKSFGLPFPVPSVPASSSWFRPRTYWQGPTWINTNWLIIDGLKRNGLGSLAEKLTETTLELVEQHGFYEYFNPEDGTPAGASNFSWTAALSIDLKINN